MDRQSVNGRAIVGTPWISGQRQSDHGRRAVQGTRPIVGRHAAASTIARIARRAERCPSGDESKSLVPGLSAGRHWTSDVGRPTSTSCTCRARRDRGSRATSAVARCRHARSAKSPVFAFSITCSSTRIGDRRAQRQGDRIARTRVDRHALALDGQMDRGEEGVLLQVRDHDAIDLARPRSLIRLRSRSCVIGRGVATFSICSAMALASKMPTQIGRTRSPSLSFRMTIGVFGDRVHHEPLDGHLDQHGLLAAGTVLGVAASSPARLFGPARVTTHRHGTRPSTIGVRRGLPAGTGKFTTVLPPVRPDSSRRAAG